MSSLSDREHPEEKSRRITYSYTEGANRRCSPDHIKDVLCDLKSLGISPACVGDKRTLALTKRLRRTISELAPTHFRHIGSVLIRRVETGSGKGFCSIEPLAQETCGWSCFYPHLECNSCLTLGSANAQNKASNNSKGGYALAGSACLVAYVPDVPAGPLSQLRSLIIFSLDAVRNTVGTTVSNDDFDAPIPSEEVQTKALEGSVEHLPIATIETDHHEVVIPNDLLNMLEHVSKECSNFTTEDSKLILDRSFKASGKNMVAGLTDMLEGEKATKRTASAVIALTFREGSDICLYELDFDCALNFL